MVKIILEFDIGIEDFQERLEADQCAFEYDMPEDTAKTIEVLSDGNDLTQFADLIDKNDEDFKINEFQFEDKAEKEDFEKWLKEKIKEEDQEEEEDDEEEED